jgi:putative transposase
MWEIYQVMKKLPKWFNDYNEKAPHKALNMLSARKFLKMKKLAS